MSAFSDKLARAKALLRDLSAASASDAWRSKVKAIIARKPAPHPYELTSRNGQTIDQLTNYALYAVERRLKYKAGSLTVVQGSYKAKDGGGAPQSAGTHDQGGVVDLTPTNWQAKVRALRAVGFAAWHRPVNWDGRGGVEHIHAVLIGNAKLAPGAAVQVIEYKAGEDGLALHHRDPNPWRPSPIPVFRMPKYAQQ